MFIIRISHKESIPGMLRSDNAYKEVETEAEAFEFYREMLEMYPYSVDVRIFGTEEVIPPKEILETILAAKDRETKEMIFKEEVARRLEQEDAEEAPCSHKTIILVNSQGAHLEGNKVGIDLLVHCEECGEELFRTPAHGRAIINLLP